MDTTLPVIFLMGPTASGKTTLALALHRQLPVEIISVDSAMVYRGMDIGTAKPGPEILKQVPHRLIDICDPVESYSVGRFCEDALAAISEIHAQQKIPLLVGGTGLYFRTLEQGISALPPADLVIRAALEAEARQIGSRGMHERLAAIDAESAHRIHPNDPQRIQRALEVYEITGKPLSDFFSEGRQTPLPYTPVKIIIAPDDRAVIHARVQQRFIDMMDAGLLEEVRVLYENQAIHAALPAMRMVGYRQIWRYLDGSIDYQTMLEYAIVATRQLAKRQMTWLRSEQNGVWFDSNHAGFVAKILKFLLKDPNLSLRV